MLTHLDSTRRDELAEKFATRICAWGMEAPALFFLEGHRSLSFLGGQILLGLQPFLGLVWGDASARELALFFEREENIGQLIERLEKQGS
jgi:hypothetical protein